MIIITDLDSDRFKSALNEFLNGEGGFCYDNRSLYSRKGIVTCEIWSRWSLDNLNKTRVYEALDQAKAYLAFLQENNKQLDDFLKRNLVTIEMRTLGSGVYSAERTSEETLRYSSRLVCKLKAGVTEWQIDLPD